MNGFVHWLSSSTLRKVYDNELNLIIGTSPWEYKPTRTEKEYD